MQFQSTEIAGDCSFFLCKLVFFFQERILFILRYFLLFFPLSLSLFLPFSLFCFLLFFLSHLDQIEKEQLEAGIHRDEWMGWIALQFIDRSQCPFSLLLFFLFSIFFSSILLSFHYVFSSLYFWGRIHHSRRCQGNRRYRRYRRRTHTLPGKERPTPLNKCFGFSYFFFFPLPSSFFLLLLPLFLFLYRSYCLPFMPRHFNSIAIIL